MATFIEDLRVAFRELGKSPVLTLVVVISIGLALGANTTVFAWMESLILNPYPLVEDGDRLVAVNLANRDGTGAGSLPFSYPSYLDWREEVQSFDGMIGHALARFNLRTGGEAQGDPVYGELVSGNYFEVLGVSPLLGRTFLATEETSAAPVAVVSYSLWQRKFGGDAGIIGRHVILNGADLEIIGVTPEGWSGVLVGYGFELWVPVTLQPILVRGPNRLVDRNARWLQGTARLKAGVALAQAQAEMRQVARRVSEARGEQPVTGAVVRRMRERFTGSLMYPLFSALLVVTGLVLLIACANVANLLMARASARRKEIGIRLALGAGASRILRQLLTESLLLSLLGGILGLLLAAWAKDLFLTFIPPTPQPVLIVMAMNVRIILFAFLVTLLTTVVFGLAPALRATRLDLVRVLKAEGRASRGASRSKLRSALVVGQVAFCLVALVCAGLFLKSLRQAQTLELGFADPGRVLLAGTDLNLTKLTGAEAVAATDRLLDQVRALPAVTSASFSTMVPLGFGGHALSVTEVEGYTPARDEQMGIERVVVSDGYFETMGIPLVEGRGISTGDRAGGLRVAVINEAFVGRFWPGQAPLGRRINQGEGWVTVVGVAKDAVYRDLGETPYPVVYSALPQSYTTSITLHVRTVLEAKLLTEDARRAFLAASPDLPFLNPRTLAEHISASTFVQFIGASMLSVFGGLALLLAGVGLYGVLSYLTSQRQSEMATRLAIGAAPGDMIRLVLAEGLRLAALGLAVGVALALAAGRALQSQLLGVSPSDPATFAIIGIVLMAVALIASFVPSWRAAQVDPATTLKSG